MSKVVVDASVLLALMLREPGAEAALEYLEDAVVSTVNLAEVQTKLVKGGDSPELAWSDALSLVPDVRDFDAEQAKLAGTLVAKTKPYGLSLGDRACLSLGMRLNLPVCTTDSAWKKLKFGVPVYLIR